MSGWQPDIFQFIDYRLFLLEYYQAAKANIPAFSYRFFSKKAGYKSTNFLKLVIKGERGLSEKSIAQFSRALDLNDQEKRFFHTLVKFSQAKSAEEKDKAFHQLSASRRFRQARRIEHGMYEYLSKWYYPAIREMAGRADFREDAEWIGLQLFPNVPPKDVEKALHLLIDLGLLERDEDGSLRRGDPSLTTGHEVQALAARNYHQGMLQRAAESIENVNRDHRELSAITACITRETFLEIREEIRSFRERLFERCDRDENPKMVYQINIQCFPLTQFQDE